MMQKSNEEIYKALSEAERNLAEKNVGWILSDCGKSSRTSSTSTARM